MALLHASPTRLAADLATALDTLGLASIVRRDATARAMTHLAALRHHLTRDPRQPPFVAFLGGTGAGKSTLINRLIEKSLTATSFKRTHTAGPVAVAASGVRLPEAWAERPLRAAEDAELPPRGNDREVIVVSTAPTPLLEGATLIDAPDLDGELPEHHAIAERLFRFADAVVFVTTPEKYQMTELWPFYRLADRYAVPALFVINKLDDSLPADDFAARLASAGLSAERIYQVARDDSTHVPPNENSLEALRARVTAIRTEHGSRPIARGVAARTADLRARLADQVFAPLRADRSAVDRAAAALSRLVLPEPGVDVNAVTADLQQRLQRRSVLYLIGPGRVIDRVRQVPGLLARLPRTTWDLLRGKPPAGDVGGPTTPAELPDFPRLLADQFRLLHGRIDDLLAESKLPPPPDWKLAPAQAAAIADEELGALRTWLEQRWNATPRDTAAIKRVLKQLPGGEKLVKMSEAAPYLLAIACAAHGALFGHLDLMILGGYGLATWLVERISNEVASRTRSANRAISARFTRLAEVQVDRLAAALRASVPEMKAIDRAERLTEDLAQSLADAAEAER